MKYAPTPFETFFSGDPLYQVLEKQAISNPFMIQITLGNITFHPQEDQKSK
jgi:hypothetical protein